MVLVSIVGDFYSSVLPLFYEFREKVTKHIIIHDDFKNDVKYAKQLINGTQTFIRKNKLQIKTEIITIDEDSIFAIKQLIKVLHQHISSPQELFLNVTDGLANIGILLTQEFLDKGSNILTYDRYDNEYNLLTKSDMKTCAIQNTIPIKDHLELKGLKILNCAETKTSQKYEHDLNIFFEKYEADKELYFASKESKQGLKSFPVGFLYEFYIFNLIKNLNFDDILLGVQIQSSVTDDFSYINEFDILIMKNNHLHMIECKYQKQLDTVALIYKLDSVREVLDEDAYILTATDFDNYDEVKETPTHSLNPSYKRAFSKKLFFRGAIKDNPRQFIKDVDKIFSLHSENIDTIIEQKSSYSSIKEPQRVKLKDDINSYLSNRLKVTMDFFEKNSILLLLNYKTYKETTQEIRTAMKEEKFKMFIKLIMTMLSSKKEYISIYDVYDYYIKELKVPDGKKRL